MNRLTTRVQPSRIGLGTVSFGTTISREDSFRIMDAFFDAGGTFIDTAHIYASWLENGAGMSERTVGAWLRERGTREAVILSTKGGHPPLNNMEDGRCSSRELRKDLSESLERLGVSSVDIYWLHRDDPGRPAGEIVETLAGFVREGTIRCFGGSNWTIPRFEAANAYAASHGLPGFVASQPGWALADRSDGTIAVDGMRYLSEQERQWHEQTGFLLVAYTAAANGYFSRDNVSWAAGGFEGKPPRGEIYDSPGNRQRLLRAMEIARQEGCTPNQVALAYLLNQSFPVIALVGTRNPDHIREALEAQQIILTEDVCRYLREGC